MFCLDIVNQINSVIANLNMFISPTLIRNIYYKYLKCQPESLISTPSYSILLALNWTLSTLSTCLMFYEMSQNAPTFMICIGAIGNVLAAMIMFCFLLVIGVSTESLNLRIEAKMKKGQTVESLRLFVTNYQNLVSVLSPSLFLSYSSHVCNLIMMIYIVSGTIASCHVRMVRLLNPLQSGPLPHLNQSYLSSYLRVKRK